MFWKKSDIERTKSFESIEGLGLIVRRLIQEVEVLKGILEKNGLWSEDQYRQAIVDRFLSDHNSVGPGIGPSHSDFYYTFGEEDFLKSRLNFSDEEIKAFDEKVQYL